MTWADDDEVEGPRQGHPLDGQVAEEEFPGPGCEGPEDTVVVVPREGPPQSPVPRSRRRPTGPDPTFSGVFPSVNGPETPAVAEVAEGVEG